MDGAIELNDKGHLVRDSWEWLAARHPYVMLDEYVVMPNHLHGIITIDDQGRGGSRTAPISMPRKSLGRIIGAFKTVSTKRLHLCHKKFSGPIWQRNYYEHVIRNDRELTGIREYIANNPVQWELDRYNPEAQERRTQLP